MTLYCPVVEARVTENPKWVGQPVSDSCEANFWIVGGSIISKKKLAELSDADQQVLLDTAKRAAAKLDQIVGRDDARSYQTLLGRGIVEVDAGADAAAWDAAATKAREELAARGVYSKSLLKAVESAATN